MRKFIDLITSPVNETLNESRHLTPTLKKQRDKVSRALEREHPEWPKPKVYAIVTKAAEKTVKENSGEDCFPNKINEDKDDDRCTFILVDGTVDQVIQHVGDWVSIVTREVRDLKKMDCGKVTTKEYNNETEGYAKHEPINESHAILSKMRKYVQGAFEKSGLETSHDTGVTTTDKGYGYTFIAANARAVSSVYSLINDGVSLRDAIYQVAAEQKHLPSDVMTLVRDDYKMMIADPRALQDAGVLKIHKAMANYRDALDFTTEAFGTAGMATKVGDSDEVKLSVFINKEDIPAVSKIFHDNYINPEVHEPLSPKIGKFRVTGECTRAEGNLIIRAIKMAGIDAGSRLL